MTRAGAGRPVETKPAPSSSRPPAPKRFAGARLAELAGSKYLYIRAGREHRFIGIWLVVVEGRVFVRSWSVKPRSWYRTFLEHPLGAIRLGDREVPVRALRVRSERLNAAVDRAYLEKYNTRASSTYARDLGSAKSRATTTELVPWRAASGSHRAIRA
jgi:hypothetical protein